MITQSRDASSALATRTATAAEPTRTSQKSSELRSVSKARRPAGSAPQCCKPGIGHSVICRSARTGVRAGGREHLHLQRQQQQQANPKQRKRVFLASPPLPSLGASLEYASGRKMRHPRSKWEKGVRPWPAHPAACCAAGPTRDALACGGPNGLCSQLLVSLLLLAGVVCAGSARAMYLGWGSCLLVGFLFLVSFCDVRVLVLSIYARLRAVASYEVLLRKAGASSLMLRDVHFRRPHNTLKTSERSDKRHGLSCAVAQEKRENLKSSRKRNYDHAGDVAIVDKSYRRNSCLISSSHDRDAERADRREKNQSPGQVRHRQMEKTPRNLSPPWPLLARSSPGCLSSDCCWFRESVGATRALH